MEGGIGSLCFMGTEFRFYKMKRALETDAGDACIKTWMYLCHWTLHLKMINVVNCMLHFTTIKKWKKNKHGVSLLYKILFEHPVKWVLFGLSNIEILGALRNRFLDEWPMNTWIISLLILILVYELASLQKLQVCRSKMLASFYKGWDNALCWSEAVFDWDHPFQTSRFKVTALRAGHCGHNRASLASSWSKWS